MSLSIASAQRAFRHSVFASCALVAAFAACAEGEQTSTSGSDGGGGGSPCAPACTDPAKPVCDPVTATCVGCIPSDDQCPTGEVCDVLTNACREGCEEQAECESPLLCNTSLKICVTCLDDSQCNPGTICSDNGECVPGCSPTHACETGLSCCGSDCVDLASDALHCGDCAAPCPTVANALVQCTASQCLLGNCNTGFENCNLDSTDGCEWNLTTQGACMCTEGATMSCYEGPLGTLGVGTCVAGVSTCNVGGTGWGPCNGQVFPVGEVCADGLDNDCDGTPDNPQDADGDGWTACEGDCCDVAAVGACGTPDLVNPGAYEVAGNTVDDDCDGTIDNALGACDTGLASDSSAALDYARAIELCQTTIETPTLPLRKWGVISASFLRADGTSSPAVGSRSIRVGYGTNVSPLAGDSLAVLSTGIAAAQNSPNNTNPNYATFQAGQSMGTVSGVPADWYALNGNAFPNAPGCPAPAAGTTVNDPMMLKVRVRVPTNAKSFSVSSDFYSAEYPEWVCSPFNDFFLTLLDSTFVPGMGQTANPADKNLAFYDPPPVGGAVYPIGVNLAYGNTGLFRQCKNGPTGCANNLATPGTTSACTSTSELVGTGFDVLKPPNIMSIKGYCMTNDLLGGATGWLTTSGNVKPGETIELRFVLWDTSDHFWDSLVLLDNFQWSLNASTPGTK